jgi:acyl-CoA synthetase (AMP-forming)/AMP-acid ligase II
MPIATIEKLNAKIPGLKLMNCYGSTETTSPSTIMPGELTASHIDSVGLPCPGAHIMVMDADGHELPRGEIGEIWIHSGSVIKGYWNNPTATAESFTGGFWHSGDLGSIDDENFVRVFDRRKDMINRGGLKIYSAEVESVLAGHPDVVESAIIAKPCPVLGERVHAVIVTRHGDVPGFRCAPSGSTRAGALNQGVKVLVRCPAVSDFARSFPRREHYRRSPPR